MISAGSLLTVAALTLVLVARVSSLIVQVYPPGPLRIPEDTLQRLNVSLRYNTSDTLDVRLNASDARMTLTILPDEPWKLDMFNNTLNFSTQDVRDGANASFYVSGYYWGYTPLHFYIAINHVDEKFMPGTLIKDDYVIIVDRATKVLDTIFISVGTLFILFTTINMGCQLDLQLIWSVLKKPVGPACGFLSQFALMPVLSYMMGYFFFDDMLSRLGIFTLGCCPGGLMSNFWTLMFNGDLNLSITMTFVSTVAAMGMMPMWMYTLGLQILSSNIQVPFVNLATSLLVLTVPIGIGILIKNRRPKWAEMSKKIVRPITFIAILFFLTVGVYNSYKIFAMMTWQMITAGFLVAVCGYSFGALFALSWCLPRNKVIAISIETAMQNGGVAFMLLKLSLPTPESDLASIPVLAQVFMTGPPMMLVFLVYQGTKRCCSSFRKITDKPPDAESRPENLYLPVASDDPASQNTDTVKLSPPNKKKYTIELNGLTKKALANELSDTH